MIDQLTGNPKKYDRVWNKIGALFIDGYITFDELVRIRERLRKECGLIA